LPTRYEQLGRRLVEDFDPHVRDKVSLEDLADLVALAFRDH
jgi:hypothetical protein